MSTRRFPGPRAVPTLVAVATLASIGWLQSIGPAGAAGPPPSQVSVGSTSSCAAMSDGTVRCWGDNSHGQLGNGITVATPPPTTLTTSTTTTTSTTAPIAPTQPNPTANRFMAVTVTGLSGIKQVGVGAAHACALATAGRVWCWGDNSHGQVGASPWLSGSNVFAPIDITPPNVVVAGLSVGLNHNCLWSTVDRLYCWGDGTKGQLGRGPNLGPINATPTIVSTYPGSGIVAIGTGEASTCVQFDHPFLDFSVVVFKLFTYMCSGSNSSGEFGNSSYVSTTYLKAVANLSSSSRTIAFGWMHSCRLDSSTSLVTCTGRNWEGQLGDGTNTSSPVMVSVAGTYSRLSTGSAHTCGYDTTRAEYRCWGHDSQGQLGDGMTTNANTPRTVAGLKVAADAASIDAGGHSTCAIVDDGPLVRRVYCWGSNEFGQLGNGSKGGATGTPVVVRGL